MGKPIVTVIGSINMDMITTTKTLPKKGETILGENYQTNPGGKGANQAVAAARLGAEVRMIGQVGNDAFGLELIRMLDRENIDTSMIDIHGNTNTGTATITLADNDNRIIVVPGANESLSPSYIEQYKGRILKSDIVLVQFEIPLKVIRYCIDFCYENGIPIIINPAPALTLPEEYWLKAAYITPNEIEYKQILSDFQSKLDSKIIVTMGKEGVSYQKDGHVHDIPAYPVNPADTTGAGDTFNGALAVALAGKYEILEAIKFANAAAALSTLKVGAQSGMPWKAELEKFLGTVEFDGVVAWRNEKLKGKC
ncbi:ribokinase [Oceanobacillus sp. CFH 90083]|uniref:ribokinase n=1 Tax=Oceanobacillus sp. CFH 90083 TaxID=2592336 RepID=UPI00128DA404|nr:ribokinase [Oceanobacillus sp. CFH 90083]